MGATLRMQIQIQIQILYWYEIQQRIVISNNTIIYMIYEPENLILKSLIYLAFEYEHLRRLDKVMLILWPISWQ